MITKKERKGPWVVFWDATRGDGYVKNYNDFDRYQEEAPFEKIDICDTYEEACQSLNASKFGAEKEAIKKSRENPVGRFGRPAPGYSGF